MAYLASSGFFHVKKCNSMAEAKDFVRGRKGWTIKIYQNGRLVAKITK